MNLILGSILKIQNLLLTFPDAPQRLLQVFFFIKKLWIGMEISKLWIGMEISLNFSTVRRQSARERQSMIMLTGCLPLFATIASQMIMTRKAIATISSTLVKLEMKMVKLLLGTLKETLKSGSQTLNPNWTFGKELIANDFNQTYNHSLALGDASAEASLHINPTSS